MEKKVKVGDVLYDYKLNEFVVNKVGNKYFECEGSRDKITIETLKYESDKYTQANYQLYKSKQEILDIKETGELEIKLRKAFDFWSREKTFTLDQLRRISEITDEQ